MLKAGEQYIVFGTQNISFVDSGLTNTHVDIIYRIGTPSESWAPDRDLNPIENWEVGIPYLFTPKVDIDFLDTVVQPARLPSLISEISVFDFEWIATGGETSSVVDYRLIGSLPVGGIERGNEHPKVILPNPPATVTPTETQILFDNILGKLTVAVGNEYEAGELVKTSFKKLIA